MLKGSLNAAASSYAQGNMVACANELRAFQMKVAAQSGRKIGPSSAATLIKAAQTAIASISIR
jgi:hypothetical protein